MTLQDKTLKVKQPNIKNEDILTEKEAKDVEGSFNNAEMLELREMLTAFKLDKQKNVNEEHNHDEINSQKIDAFNINWESVIRSIIKLNGTQIKALSVELVDDATINLPDATSGVGVITADGEEGAIFIWTSAAVVTLIANSGNVSASSVDTDLCIYDGGTSVTIENKLGASKTIKYLIIY